MFSAIERVLGVRIMAGVASNNDWIALYCPGDPVHVRSVVPVNYAKIESSNPDYNTTGRATVRFQMINMRTSCSFYLFQDAW